MGNRRSGAAIGLALLMLIGALAGCLGAPSSGSSDAEDGAASEEDTSAGPSGNESASDGSEDAADDAGGDASGNESESGVTHETTQTSTQEDVIVSTPDTLQSPGFVLPEDAGRMTVLDSKPSDFSAIIVEVTWTSETDGQPIDHIQVEIRDEATEEGQTNAPNSAWMNETRSQDHAPVDIWVLPDDYEEGSLEIWAHPIRDRAGLWYQAEITAYTTVFRGGMPSANFTAV